MTRYDKLAAMRPEQKNHWVEHTEMSQMFERIFAEIGVAEELSKLPNGALANELVEKAVNFLYEKFTISSALTDADCLEAEQILLPLSEEAKKRTMYCIAHAHIDMDWLWGYHETVAIVLGTFRTMLDMMNEYPEFKFSQSQAATYDIVEKYDPDLFEEIKARIKEGRWEFSGSAWVESDRNLPSAESISQHMIRSKHFLAEKFGLDPKDVNMDFHPDSFGHTPVMPELLNAGGVKYFYHCRGLEGNFIYRWRAPSGAEVLAINEPSWYNDPIRPGYLSLVIPFCEMFGGIDGMIKVYGVGDHGGGPTRKDIEMLVAMQSWPVAPTVKFSTYTEYFAMLDEEYAADLPPRFTDISETLEYFHQCTENLTEDIELYVGNGSSDMFGVDYDYLLTYIPCRGYYSVNFSNSTGLLKMKVYYRAGDRIIYAEKNGKHDILIPEEKEVLEKAKLIVEEAKANSSTEFELELWIHDWICKNTEYNTPDLDKDEQIPNIGYRQHSCIGALIDGKINCQGYADTFELLGTLAGLEIRTIGGIAVNEEGEGPHAWNMIKLDGLWYFVDVTYDDPSGAPNEMYTRIWLNTPYTIDRHTPDISLNGHYDFAEVENPDYCYYDVKNLNFTSERDIAKYTVDMHGKRVKSVSVRAKGLEFSESKINSLIRSYLESYGYTYASWRTSVQYKNGNSYVTVLWD